MATTRRTKKINRKSDALFEITRLLYPSEPNSLHPLEPELEPDKPQMAIGAGWEKIEKEPRRDVLEILERSELREERDI